MNPKSNESGASFLHDRCVTDRDQKKGITIAISNYCRSGETRCRDGTCIPVYKLCDGRIQCSDRSDELREFCGESKSLFSTFKDNLIAKVAVIKHLSEINVGKP